MAEGIPLGDVDAWTALDVEAEDKSAVICLAL